MRSTRTPLLAVLALSTAAVLSACGEEEVVVADDGVILSNCGSEVSLDTNPQRIVTIKSTATELVLALGLADRIVGTAFADGPVPEAWSEEAAGLTELSDQAPSQEVVLEVEPDLIFAGWESNLAADTAGERDQLAQLGVATYVSPSACQSVGQPESMSYDLLFDHFIEAGDLLGAPAAAAALVEEQKAALAEVGTVAEGTTALWWSSATDTPYVGGGIGAPAMVMDQIGLTNVAGDVDETWTPMGWEAIVDADPDVFVLVSSDWNSAADKIEVLKANPATAALTAVQEERFLVLPFPAAEAGVRSVDAAADLVAQAGELGLAGQ